MNEALTEQEQIQAIKNWWKENGTQILIVGSLIAIGYFGYNWWVSQKETKWNEVSVAYDQYLSSVAEASTSLSPTEEQISTVNFHTDQLINEFGDTHYAVLAALNTAAFDVRRNELQSGLERLEWARAQADSEADKQLVNYRYAIVKAQLGNIDESLSLLSDSNEFFSSLYAEARGDILLAAGRSSEALNAYKAALDNLVEEDVSRKPLLEAKVTSLTNGVLAVSSESVHESGDSAAAE